MRERKKGKGPFVFRLPFTLTECHKQQRGLIKLASQVYECKVKILIEEPTWLSFSRAAEVSSAE